MRARIVLCNYKAVYSIKNKALKSYKIGIKKKKHQAMNKLLKKKGVFVEI